MIGEAVKRLPEDVKTRAPAVSWKRIAGFRDVLAHGYFALDDAIVWDIVVHEIDPLVGEVQRLIEGLDKKG